MIRNDIAEAATIADLTSVTPFYRQSLRTGDGFVRRGQRTRPGNGFGWLDTWEVWIALPADEVTAEKWLDDHVDALTEAVSGVLIVTTATPSEMQLGSTLTSGLIIAGTSPA